MKNKPSNVKKQNWDQNERHPALILSSLHLDLNCYTHILAYATFWRRDVYLHFVLFDVCEWFCGIASFASFSVTHWEQNIVGMYSYSNDTKSGRILLLLLFVYIWFQFTEPHISITELLDSRLAWKFSKLFSTRATL